MATTTEKLLVAGVVGAGVLLLFGLSKAPAAPAQAPAPGPEPTPPPPPPVPGPVTPPTPQQVTPTPQQAIPPPQVQLVLLGDPMHLRQGSYYRARLETDSQLPPFDASADEATISKVLGAMGFTGTQVYSDKSKLPPDWPLQTADQALPGTRWVQFSWGAPTADIPRPTAIVAIWQTPSPTLAAQYAAQRR